MGFSRKPRQAIVGIEEDVLPDLTVSSSKTHFLINKNKSNESLSKRDKICATQAAEDTVGSGCCRLSGEEARRVAQCTRSTRSHISRNLFSLGNGLIVILLLLLCWTCLVHGGFPGRGPPPRGPPLFPHHPHPPRSSLFSRRRPPPPPRMSPAGRHHPPHPPRPSKMKPEARSDLAVAAQTLYDLRGYQFPFTGPENQRFHRQNDPFTLPTPVAPNPRASGSHHVPQDTRTAPLVFPSFYQEQPTPAPARSTIFGHNQHLSQTRFEPPGTFHLGGNSASTKITLEQQSASTRDQFRPSQIDISLHNNQVQSTPSPNYGQQQVPSSVAPEKKSLIPSSTSRSRAPVKLHKNQHDPFVYVYDEVDYEDGDDEFTLGRHRTPQGQINNNRITPSTSTTTVAPLRSREPQLLSSPPPFQQPLYQHHNPVHQPLYSTSTTTKQPSTTANSLFFQPAKDDYRDAFRNHGIIRPPVTPRPNVEIVPSSERKPPPDQSNAIQPALVRLQNNPPRDFGRPTAPQAQIPHVADHFENRSRRPSLTTSTTTAAPQQFPTGNSHNFQRDSIVPTYHPPQGRQATPTPQTTPLPYFPSGLDRRPFETNNEIPSVVNHNRNNNHFDQVVNVLQEEEEDFPQSDVVGQLEGFNNPSKLRPVNTIIPKNRIPKEDILPPNFQFTHAQQEVPTTLAPIIPEVTSTRIRGDPVQLRVREQTRIREELPRQHQRVVSTQAPVRNRPSVIFPDDDDDDDDIDQNNIRLINQQQASTFAPPSPTPSRTRGRNPTVRPHTTTTTLAPAEVPQRTRTQSPRQRLRPTQRHTTTTTTTTTTPVPTYIEYPSQEYVDDYDNTPYQQSPAPPPQVQAPAVSEQPKSFSRFPPFPNKNKEVVTPQTTPAPTRHQRPVPQHSRPRPGKNNNNRFRETSTQDTTSPRTTGKPLYTTGRMLSKEGGLYAGQQITSSHVYGQPVPNIPINSVLDKVPGVLDGRTATTRPSYSSPQKHLRSKQRYPEHGPPSRVTTSSQRLRASPTPRPVQENSLDIVETVTLRPYQEDRSKSLEEPKRLRPGSQFLRGQHQRQSEEGGEQVLPRRRKARPGQKRLHTTSAEPFTENVALHSQKDDDDVSQFQTERAQIIREHHPETTTPGSGPTPRSRRPRPGRPNKPSQSASENVANVSERSRESSDTTSEEPQQHQQPKLVKAVRKLRPRLRPVPVGQLNPQQQRGQPSEIVAQAQSAQVERKPTDAPGRFSSRFREDNYESTTVSTLRGEVEERPSSTSTGPSRFSPSVPRATFKPPVKKAGSQQGRKRPQQQQQQQQNESDEELPASIKLSPKDVIENRKPARRIPPGSASDRLKALQQRRNKIFNGNGNRQDHGEQTAEGRQVPVTNKRPRLKAFSPAVQQQQQQEELPEEVEERPASPPQSQRLRKPLQQKQQQHTSTEAVSGQKREIVGRGQDKQVKTRNELDYYNNVPTIMDDFDEDEDSDYIDDAPIPPRHHQLANRPPKSNGFHRNRSVEVSSDEARSILGISRPAMPNRAANGKKFRPQPQQAQQQEEEEPTEEEFEEEPAQVQQPQHQQLQQQQRPPRPHHQNQRQRSRENTQEEEEQQQEQPQPPPRRQFSNQGGHQKIRPNQKPLKSKPPPPPLEEEEEEEEDQTPQYQEEPEEDRPEPPRKPFLKHHFKQNHYVSTSSIAPSTTSRKLHKNFNNNNARKVHHPQQFREEEEEEEDKEEVDRVTPSSRPRTSTFTSSSTFSTTSSSTSQTASPPPVALPQRQGPQPIKQGLLKARLRPNRRLSGGSAGGNHQPRVSVTATTTEATITEERSEERKQPGLKHGTILVSKSPRPRLNGGGGKRNSKKFISMATENPSLPLESIFPEVAR